MHEAGRAVWLPASAWCQRLLRALVRSGPVVGAAQLCIEAKAREGGLPSPRATGTCVGPAESTVPPPRVWNWCDRLCQAFFPSLGGERSCSCASALGQHFSPSTPPQWTVAVLLQLAAQVVAAAAAAAAGAGAAGATASGGAVPLRIPRPLPSLTPVAPAPAARVALLRAPLLAVQRVLPARRAGPGATQSAAADPLPHPRPTEREALPPRARVAAQLLVLAVGRPGLPRHARLRRLPPPARRLLPRRGALPRLLVTRQFPPPSRT